MICQNQRVIDLERRVAVLEEQMKTVPHTTPSFACVSLFEKYGEYVNKSKAAEILSVSRATIYAMLMDGRLKGGRGGTRVSVASIEEYIESPIAIKKNRHQKACWRGEDDEG